MKGKREPGRNPLQLLIGWPKSHNLFLVPVTLYTYPSQLSTQFTLLHGHVAEQQYWFFFCFHFLLSFIVKYLSAGTQYSFLFSSIRSIAFIDEDKASFCVHTFSLRLPCSIISDFSCVEWLSSPTAGRNSLVFVRSTNDAWRSIKCSRWLNLQLEMWMYIKVNVKRSKTSVSL